MSAWCEDRATSRLFVEPLATVPAADDVVLLKVAPMEFLIFPPPPSSWPSPAHMDHPPLRSLSDSLLRLHDSDPEEWGVTGEYYRRLP